MHFIFSLLSFGLKNNNMRFTLSILLLACTVITSNAQPDRWQQRVKYTMDIKMDVTTNQFTG
ncbi:MAG TPA: hypothetical protein VIY47_00030, partial [Ignavibacteriaceae bacterium]